MNETTKELIAIGASVTAHCQPCLTWHLQKARQLEINEADIQAAIDLGNQVAQGADTFMKQHVRNEMNQASPPQGQDSCCDGGACCS